MPVGEPLPYTSPGGKVLLLMRAKQLVSGLTSNAVGYQSPNLPSSEQNPKKGTLRHKAGPAGWAGFIIVILKKVPKGCVIFVRTSLINRSNPWLNNFHTCAIGIDPPGEAGYPHMAIIALRPTSKYSLP